MAPTEAPMTRSKLTPASTRALSIPTWTAPRLPPPASTRAVLTACMAEPRSYSMTVLQEHSWRLETQRDSQLVFRQDSKLRVQRSNRLKPSGRKISSPYQKDRINEAYRYAGLSLRAPGRHHSQAPGHRLRTPVGLGVS